MNNGTSDKDMNDHPNPGNGSGEEPVESLLRLASSRPEPSDTDREAIRTHVQGEWQKVAAKRKFRRRAWPLSVAASAVLAVTLVVLNQDQPSISTNLQEVALVERITGHVEVSGNQTPENAATVRKQTPIFVGQKLNTAADSGMALVFASGISLRIDQLTEVDMIGENTLKLEAGRIYVDTHADTPATQTVTPSRFEILTDKGAIRHLGTQYMVGIDDELLSVSVRNGNVQVIAEEVDGPSTVYVSNGMSLSFGSDGAPDVSETDVFGPQWQWAENLGAGFVLDSRTIAEFLEWVARETGFAISYESENARAVAEETVLHGTIDLPAREALDVVLKTSDLTATMAQGEITIKMKQ